MGLAAPLVEKKLVFLASPQNKTMCCHTHIRYCKQLRCSQARVRSVRLPADRS